MNILEKLKLFGAKFSTNNIDLEKQSKFVLGKDASSYHEFLYVLQYNKIPSTLLMKYNKNKFDDFLKYLIQSDFQVSYCKSTYSRRTKDVVVLTNFTKRVSIEMGSSELLDNTLFNIITESDEEDDNLFDASISYDIETGGEFVFNLTTSFIGEDTITDKGKILLFEKNEYNDMILTPHKIKHYDLDISENYNDDFLDVHHKIKAWAEDFSSKNNKLVLLHGVPGSGKTNYIKYILNNIKDTKKIYIPPYFVQSMADPAFFPVIRREKESLLIIEDAEKILINRDDSNDNSIISILLNLCDGIMADVLNFKIIATFNTDEDKIDSALKRKGRMFLRYKFDELSEEKTYNLYNKIYKENPPKKRMTLAEIYNDENEFGKKKEEKRGVGFLNI